MEKEIPEKEEKLLFMLLSDLTDNVSNYLKEKTKLRGL
jgi:hypothetical protein